MRRYLILAAIALFAIGWIATGSLTSLFYKTLSYCLEYGIDALCVVGPVLLVGWIFLLIIKGK